MRTFRLLFFLLWFGGWLIAQLVRYLLHNHHHNSWAYTHSSLPMSGKYVSKYVERFLRQVLFRIQRRENQGSKSFVCVLFLPFTGKPPERWMKKRETSIVPSLLSYLFSLTVKEEETAGRFGTLLLRDDEHVIGTLLDQERFEVAAQWELDSGSVDDTDDVSSSRSLDDGEERTFRTVLCLLGGERERDR